VKCSFFNPGNIYLPEIYFDINKKLLHIKGNNGQNQETIHQMGERSLQVIHYKGLISRIYKKLKKIKYQVKK
jgi:hypothetical protein